jgi:hypothetical protein
VHCYRYDQKVVFDRAARNYTRKEHERIARLVTARLPWRLGFEEQGKAQVPMIPPRHKPAGHLRAYRVLFEAVWERRPPVDPMLLRHVGGPFYVVVAQWDLSPLEQAVLRARL